MKTLVRKVLILSLALWTGTSSFAYASARVECADMMLESRASSMGSEADHSCCPKTVPCECSVRRPSNELSSPAGAFVWHGSHTAAPLFLMDAGFAVAGSGFRPLAAESPPLHPPLYQLFSAYRI